jgi:hypothetical protein
MSATTYECDLCGTEADATAENGHPGGWQERNVDGEVIDLCAGCATEDDDGIRALLADDDDEADTKETAAP